MGNVTGRPGFLDLPARSSKPRATGLTHVLDKGASLGQLEAIASRAGDGIDLWKLGWGTAYLEPDASEKVTTLGRHAIRACVGGTLLEIAWGQDRAEACLAWAAEAGFPCVEVSNGAAEMPLREKRRLIQAAAEGFVVLSEVGSKDPGVTVSAEAWAEELSGDLEAGATWVLTEGRESGTVGLFEPDGSVREDVVERVVERVGLSRVIFEAPRKDQQAWFVRRFGPVANLGNVAAEEVIALETLRLGLRSDTLDLLPEAGPPLAPVPPGPAQAATEVPLRQIGTAHAHP
jgi:phosphosulfolactate synthase